MHRDPGYHYEDPMHNDGYTGLAYDSNYEHPVYDSGHDQEDSGFDHLSSRLLDKLMSQGGSQTVNYDYSSHEQVEYERQVEDLVYGDPDCDYENSWLGSCLPFGFLEDLEHRVPQTPERTGHLWDYWSPKGDSSDKNLEYEGSDQNYNSLEHEDCNHEDSKCEEQGYDYEVPTLQNYSLSRPLGELAPQ